MSQNIAFFDSGQGGLTVWEAVVKRFPGLNTVYLGDNARYPYGNKSASTITRYTLEAMRHLLSEQAQLIIIACGTASSVAVKAAQDAVPLPVHGIIEGFCQEAVKLLGRELHRPIAVLGTRFTVSSGRIADELQKLGATTVWPRACPLFVPLVEEGIREGSMAEEACDMYLWDIPADVKIVMLACTHFPRLTKSIATTIHRRLNRPVISVTADGPWLLAGAQESREDPVFLLDSSGAIVDIVASFLSTTACRSQLNSNEHRLFCTDASENFSEVAHLFTSIPLPQAVQIRIAEY